MKRSTDGKDRQGAPCAATMGTRNVSVAIKIGSAKAAAEEGIWSAYAHGRQANQQCRV